MDSYSVSNRNLTCGKTYGMRGDIMLAVNYTNLRDNLEAYMDRVTGEYKTIDFLNKFRSIC